MGTSADKVAISTSADVADFRDAVKNKDKEDGDSAILTSFKSSQLLVYKDKNAFDQRNAPATKEKQEPLEEDSFITGLGASKKESLVVVVPNLQKGKINLIQQLLRCLFFLIKRRNNEYPT